MTNYCLADTVARLTVARKAHVISINIIRTKLNLQIVALLYREGVIRGFHVYDDGIRVYLKYFNNMPNYYSMQLVSLPSRRVYWNSQKLSLNYSRNALNTFYIISTTNGLKSSSDCLLGYPLCGEVLLKVQV